MKEIYYDGNLSEDTEIAKKDGKTSDLIIEEIISYILSIAFGLPAVYLLCKLFNAEFNLIINGITLTIIETISSISKIKKSIKKRNNKVKKSKEKIYYLVDDLNNSEELVDKYANNQIPTVDTKDVINAITTNEETVEKNTTYDESEEIAKYIKTTITDFYMLDSENQLKVLREIRKHIKTDDKKIDTTNLYLLEKEDIPSVLPIKRTLERK